MVVSLCIGLRYQVSVEVEVDDDVLAGVGVDPGEGELVRMTSFFLFGVAGLHLGGGNLKIYGKKLKVKIEVSKLTCTSRFVLP